MSKALASANHDLVAADPHPRIRWQVSGDPLGESTVEPRPTEEVPVIEICAAKLPNRPRWQKTALNIYFPIYGIGLEEDVRVWFADRVPRITLARKRIDRALAAAHTGARRPRLLVKTRGRSCVPESGKNGSVRGGGAKPSTSPSRSLTVV
jgi:hypothetical protein